MYALAPKCDQSAEPRWRHWRHHDRRTLTPQVRAWLLDRGSLTARLVGACDNRLRVRVLAQSWQRPLPSERRALGLRSAGHALVREVALDCGGEAWVYARSVLPARALRGEMRHLRRFGTRSLGALLFARHGLKRTDFEVARVAPGHRLLHATLATDTTVWARRSCFDVGPGSLLVQEVFLPACRLGSL